MNLGGGGKGAPGSSARRFGAPGEWAQAAKRPILHGAGAPSRPPD